MVKAAIAAAALLLAGCGHPAVPAAQEQAALRVVDQQLSPFRPRLVAAWYANGLTDDTLICGEVEATPLIRDQQSTLRFVFYGGGGARPFASIEPHLMPLGDDVTGAAIAAEGEAIFAHMWASSCEPYAPLGRRIAGWFSGPRDPGRPDTPLTNAYAADVIAQGGRGHHRR
ncbi:hypothetical protein [Sphingomonas sp.]|uniref:hypothetical protein n=1 Tax=Sphingomonas sp. TaxID=28214 RepID=UPI003CC523AE